MSAEIDHFRLEIFTPECADVYLSAANCDGPTLQLVERFDEASVRVIGDVTGFPRDEERVRRIMSECSALVSTVDRSLKEDWQIGAELGIPAKSFEETEPVDAFLNDVLKFQQRSKPQRIRPYAFYIGRLERDFTQAREAIRVAVENEAGIPFLWADDGRHRTNVESLRERTRLLLKYASFVITDLTLGVESPERENPSRAHEIGMAMAYEKKVLLLSQEPRRYPYFSIIDLQMVFWLTEADLEQKVKEWVRNNRDYFGRTIWNHRLPEPKIAPLRFQFNPNEHYIGPNFPVSPRFTLNRKCVYCLDNGELKAQQILLRGDHLYLCAPRGQVIEGYLAISPYSCIGCLAHLPAECFEELARLKAVVAAFYLEAYGCRCPTIYEQGRGGRGAFVDPADGFPLHAHLCCLPAAIDLHGILARKYVPLALRSPDQLSATTNNRPYVYVESADGAGAFRIAAYVAASNHGDADLERERLKPAIAAALNVPERADWRAYPGDSELTRVLERYAAFQRANVV